MISMWRLNAGVVNTEKAACFRSSMGKADDRKMAKETIHDQRFGVRTYRGMKTTVAYSLCLSLLMAGAASLLGCSEKKHRDTDGDTTKGAAQSKNYSPREVKPVHDFEGISQLLTELASETNDERIEELNDILDSSYPQCMPHLLKIAGDVQHPGSVGAIYSLGSDELGSFDEEARKFVVSTLTDATPKRRAAATFILYLHDWAEATDEYLVKTWQADKEPAVRAAVVDAVTWRPELTPEIWQIVRQALIDPEKEVCASGYYRLEILGEKVQKYYQDLKPIYEKSGDTDYRVTILNVLAQCRMDKTDAAFLKKILTGPASSEHMAALEAMLTLPPTTENLIDVALPSLRQMKYYDLRRAAVAVIAHQRPVTARQVNLLRKTARDHICQITRSSAIKGLANLGPEAADAIDDLVAIYQKNKGERDDAIQALIAIQPDHPLILQHVRGKLRAGELGFIEEEVIKSLDDESFESLFDDLLAYGEIRLKKKESSLSFFANEVQYKQLTQLPEPKRQQMAGIMARVISKTTDTNTRGYACMVIQLLGEGGTSALDQVREVLRTQKYFEAYHALHAIGRMGTKAASAKPEVEALLQTSYRSLAAAVMAKIEPSSVPRSLAILRGELKKNGGTCNSALAAIACLGPTAGELLPEVKKLATETGDNQFMARVTMGAIGDSSAIIKSFIDDLRSTDEDKRMEACHALVFLQKYAHQAVPVLREMMEKDPSNSMFYAGAINQITQERLRAMVWGFNCIPGGYPW